MHVALVLCFQPCGTHLGDTGKTWIMGRSAAAEFCMTSEQHICKRGPHCRICWCRTLTSSNRKASSQSSAGVQLQDMGKSPKSKRISLWKPGAQEQCRKLLLTYHAWHWMLQWGLAAQTRSLHHSVHFPHPHGWPSAACLWHLAWSQWYRRLHHSTCAIQQCLLWQAVAARYLIVHS